MLETTKSFQVYIKSIACISMLAHFFLCTSTTFFRQNNFSRKPITSILLVQKQTSLSSPLIYSLFQTANPLLDSGIHLSFCFPAELIDTLESHAKIKESVNTYRDVLIKSNRLDFSCRAKENRTGREKETKRLEFSRSRICRPFADWVY